VRAPDSIFKLVVATLKEMNWAFGYGDVKSVNQRSGLVTIERPHMQDTKRQYRLFKDQQGRFKVRFAGRERLVRERVFTFKVVG
jgi:hypothetical protein